VYFVHCVPGHIGGHCTLPDVTIQEMFLFLSIMLQMGHSQREAMKQLFVTLLNKNDKMRQTEPHMPTWTSTLQQQQN